MIEAELPFGPSTAQRLMAIARDRRLRNPGHALLLPPSWYILYRLTLLSDAELSRLLSDGRIRGYIERQDSEPLKPIPPEIIKPQPRPQRSQTVHVTSWEGPPLTYPGFKPASENLTMQPPRTARVMFDKQPDRHRLAHVSGYKADTPPSEPATRSQAFRIIENLELLEELLADKTAVNEVVDLLYEATRSEQLFRVCRALHALKSQGLD